MRVGCVCGAFSIRSRTARRAYHYDKNNARTGVGVEGDERDAEGLRLLLGADGGGDCHDVLQLARLELLAQALHCCNVMLW